MAQTLTQTLNRADPNTLADIFRSLKIGDVLRALPVAIRRSTTAADVSVVAAAFVVSDQFEDARATAIPEGTILSAYARAGAGAPGALNPVAYPPAVANDIAIAPNGSLVTLAADAWTDVDVSYTVEKGDVLEVSGSVVANSLPLPSNVTIPGAVLLISANALTGASTGFKFVATGAPAAGEAALNAAKDAVLFNAADAVTSATVRLLVASSVDVNAALEADSTFV